MSCCDETTCLDSTEDICKHVDDVIVIYCDAGPLLLYTDATVASVVVSCTDDLAITITEEGVVDVETTGAWMNEEGQVVPITIEANKGVKAKIAGGTAQESTDDAIRIWFAMTLSTGEVINRAGRLRVYG